MESEISLLITPLAELFIKGAATNVATIQSKAPLVIPLFDILMYKVFDIQYLCTDDDNTFS